MSERVPPQPNLKRLPFRYYMLAYLLAVALNAVVLFSFYDRIDALGPVVAFFLFGASWFPAWYGVVKPWAEKRERGGVSGG